MEIIFVGETKFPINLWEGKKYIFANVAYLFHLQEGRLSFGFDEFKVNFKLVVRPLLWWQDVQGW